MKIQKRGILLIVIVIVALLAVYFTFFYARKCSDKSCFNSALSKCKRVSFLNDIEGSTWLYTIKGLSKGECEVNVKLVKFKEGNTDLIKLEGKEMNCYLPKGMIANPQESLGRCHGLLKEEMQDVIITRLHNYIVDNLGQIGEELEKPL